MGVLYKQQKNNYICCSQTTVYRLLNRVYHNTTVRAKSLEDSCSWLSSHYRQRRATQYIQWSYRAIQVAKCTYLLLEKLTGGHFHRAPAPRCPQFGAKFHPRQTFCSTRYRRQQQKTSNTEGKVFELKAKNRSQTAVTKYGIIYCLRCSWMNHSSCYQVPVKDYHPTLSALLVITTC